MSGGDPQPKISPWWITGPAVAMLAAVVLLRFAISDFSRYRRIVEHERGLVENLTVLFSLIAAAILFAALRDRKKLPRGWLVAWFSLCAVGCVLYAGEEASWGQHWFGWSSPEYFADQNRQGETNLHNLGKYSTQRIPKALLTIGVLGSGLAAWRRGRRDAATAGPVSWWLPAFVTLPVVGVVFLTRLFERLKTWLHLEQVAFWDINFKEVNEMFLSWFFVVYALAVLVRLRSAPLRT